MRSLPVLPLLFGAALLVYPSARLAAQAQQHAVDRPLSRRVSALRLQTMLESSEAGFSVTPRGQAAAPEVLPPLAPVGVRLTGRTIFLPLTGPLRLRAGVSWWSTGLRSFAGLNLRF